MVCSCSCIFFLFKLLKCISLIFFRVIYIWNRLFVRIQNFQRVGEYSFASWTSFFFLMIHFNSLFIWIFIFCQIIFILFFAKSNLNKFCQFLNYDFDFDHINRWCMIKKKIFSKNFFLLRPRWYRSWLDLSHFRRSHTFVFILPTFDFKFSGLRGIFAESGEWSGKRCCSLSKRKRINSTR